MSNYLSRSKAIQMKKAILLFLIFSATIFSCKEDIPPPTRTELLTDFPWFPYGDDVPDCEHDDPINFKEDGTLTVSIDEGIPCSMPAEKHRLFAFWRFYLEDKFILFYDATELDTFTIKTLTKDELSLITNSDELLLLKH